MSENNQYTTSKVQAKDFTSGWTIALVLAGMGFSLPIMYLGSEIALSIGLKDALIAYGISTVVLTVLCFATTIVGNRSRLSTYMILRFPFGEQGAKIINFIIGLILLGWFSVALELLAKAIQETGGLVFDANIPLWSIVVFTSIFITVTTIYGIRSLERLANIAVPLLTVFLFYATYKALGQDTEVTNLWAYLPSPNNEMKLRRANNFVFVFSPLSKASLSKFCCSSIAFSFWY